MKTSNMLLVIVVISCTVFLTRGILSTNEKTLKTVKAEVQQSEARAQVKSWAGKIRCGSQDPAIIRESRIGTSQEGTINECDPWGHLLKFWYGSEIPGTSAYMVRSAGPDGECNTEDDVTAWGNVPYDGTH